MAELQKEIDEERSREELRRIGQKSGVLDLEGGNQKLEWMYRGPKDLVNREEYLLGRAVDKTFEQLSQEEELEQQHQQQDVIGVSVPKNHVEHECIPFSIRAYKGTDSNFQVDMARKVMEDPLMAIRQKEIESRRKILENPVKLKELKELLQSESSAKKNKDKKKTKEKDKKKKSKKESKKKSKKRRKSSSSDDDSDDLDAILMRKYSKIQDVINQEVDNDSMDLQELVNFKYDKLNEELDKMGSSSKKKEADKKNSKKNPENSPEATRKTDNSGQNLRPDDRSQRRRSPSPRSVRHNRDSFRNYDRNQSSRSNYRSRSNSPKQRSRNYYRKSPTPPRRSNQEDRPRPGPSRELNKTRRSLSSRNSDDDEDRPKYKQRAFGLVSADGKPIELKRQPVERPKKTTTPPKSADSKRNKPVRLTDEEKQRKLKEMQRNAEWRDEVREKKVSKYYEDEKRSSAQEAQREFDRNFLTNELTKAARSETVESRIKSNRNNIQRNSAMDYNFAKR